MFLSSDVVWIFPTFHGIYIFYLFLLLLAAFVYVKVMNYLNHKQEKTSTGWNDFLKYAIARKCNQAEINILHAFYDSLEPETAEYLLHPENRGKLKNALYKFFLSAPENPSEKEVELFDKLFRSSAEYRKEIQSLEDVTVGEVCALEADGREELTYVMQKTDSDVLLSAKALSKDFLEPGKKAKLYVFRPNSGGYLFPGEVTRSTEKGLIFHLTAPVEKKGEAHLMLPAKYTLIISPWPHEENEKENLLLDKNKLLLSEENIDRQIELLKRIAKEQKQGKEERFKMKETPRSFTAISERITDRGLTFEFPPTVSHDVWKHQDLWEVHFTFPDGPTVDVRGKMFPVKQKSDLYLLRFVDADESLRKLMYEEIKKRGGSRELLH
ncbi:hypothetical protein LPTSP4_20230 [Leptospira ryugenii]|uniref:Uncharacterized protein n=1 Tax=Leptospira ryugenii TaxID=1917863 RepID=A0A2P2E0T2_9LEPT|nr:hypothetical protein [Leptospira ryugenii]GBF50497.1 hypothetical protein LPTSP4_20230 [Leptospira ryugenii]